MPIVAAFAVSAALLSSCVADPASARSGAASNPTLVPQDEAARRPDFLAFRQRLLVAVGRRDTDAILMAADPAVVTDFGGGEGLDRLAALIKDPAHDFWRTFGDVLNMGGTFTAEDKFAAPYVYSAWPDALDTIDCVAVTGAGVRLRDRPVQNGGLRGTLAFDIVERIEEDTPAAAGWTRVRMANGVEGYVASRFVRGPSDYRAEFVRTAAGWRLMAFVAGD